MDIATTQESTRPADVRSPVKAVALPTEHGGWALTMEPALLGLLVEPNWAGVCLAAVALLAFVARTPLKVVLVDRWRRRWLARTSVALRVAAVELAVLAALLVVTFVVARHPFWVPLALAAPLIITELAFDMRSRSRRLVPEVAGTVGIGAVAAAVVLAGGGDGTLAAGLWWIITARAAASLPFVRLQLDRWKGRATTAAVRLSDLSQAIAVIVAAVALVVDDSVAAGLAAIVALAAFEVIAARRAPPKATVLGIQQAMLGLLVVVVTAIGVAAA